MGTATDRPFATIGDTSPLRLAAVFALTVLFTAFGSESARAHKDHNKPKGIEAPAPPVEVIPAPPPAPLEAPPAPPPPPAQHPVESLDFETHHSSSESDVASDSLSADADHEHHDEGVPRFLAWLGKFHVVEVIPCF